MPELEFQQGNKKAKSVDTPPQKGGGTPVRVVKGFPLVTNLADADSIITQPRYNNLSKPLDVTNPNVPHPKDLIGAANYLTPTIKGYMTNLDKAFATYKTTHPGAKELPYDEGVKALGANNYADYLAHVNVYNKYRGKTTLDPRNANGKWGMTDTFGNSNSGGGIIYGNITPYDSTLQNLFTPYAPPK